MTITAMRYIYRAIVIPQMLYGVAAWFQPANKKQANQISSQFSAVQKRAACLISGAFRTTAAEALNAELHLLPMKLQMD